MTDWQQVVRDNSPEIWKTAYRLVGNRDDAADCVQETFLSAIRLGNSKPVEHWGAFLHRIATARALDCLRKRYQTSTRREPVPPDWNSLPDFRPDPQRLAQGSELVQKLLRALVESAEATGRGVLPALSGGIGIPRDCRKYGNQSKFGGGIVAPH